MHGLLVPNTYLGPQDDFNYEKGYSISHISRLTQLDKKILTVSKHAGITGPFRGGLTVEEPFIHTFISQQYPSKDLFNFKKAVDWSTNTEKQIDVQPVIKSLIVLSRSLYIGNILNSSATELYQYFSHYAAVETLEYKPNKQCCFLKLRTRAMTEYLFDKCHLQIYKNSVLKIGWACGYGSKESFDYKNGINIIPYDKLNASELHHLKVQNLSNPCEEPSYFKNKYI
eukprot:NODE_257_length_12663_cov_0.723655.p6 type:complete len:227 gc:universal NODE_257_length_12663_cov_0.723655:7443-8123(+)